VRRARGSGFVARPQLFLHPIGAGLRRRPGAPRLIDCVNRYRTMPVPAGHSVEFNHCDWTGAGQTKP
jgi:hypothetical protein